MENIKDNKVAVIGGGGFIGSHLVDKLLCNDNLVVVIDNFLFGNKITNQKHKRLKLYNQDINILSNLKNILKDVEYVFYLSSIVGVDVIRKIPIDVIYSDSIGLWRTLQSIDIKKDIRFVYTSSSSVFGDEINIITENTPLRPTSHYNTAKIFSEYLIDAYNEQLKTNFKIVRLFNVYGPRQDKRMVIPRFFNYCKYGEKIKIYGDGKQTRDFTYINDVIDALIHISLSSSSVIKVNIASGIETSINDLAEMVMEVIGKQVGKEYLNIPHHRRVHEYHRRVGSTDVLSDHFHYKCKTSLKDGLKMYYKSLCKFSESGKKR